MMDKNLFSKILKEAIERDNNTVQVSYKGSNYTEADIKDMKDWIKDCQWGDLDSDEVDDLTNIQVLKGVDKHYEGGLTAWKYNNSLSEGTGMEFEVPEEVVEALEKLEYKFADLQKKEIRDSIRKQAKEGNTYAEKIADYINTVIMPTVRLKEYGASSDLMDEDYCKECGGAMTMGVCQSCGSESPKNKEWGMPDEVGHQAVMAKGELRDLIQNAANLYKMIQPGTKIPAWCAAYITLASDYIHSVYEFGAEQAQQ